MINLPTNTKNVFSVKKKINNLIAFICVFMSIVSLTVFNFKERITTKIKKQGYFDQHSKTPTQYT